MKKILLFIVAATLASSPALAGQNKEGKKPKITKEQRKAHAKSCAKELNIKLGDKSNKKALNKCIIGKVKASS